MESVLLLVIYGSETQKNIFRKNLQKWRSYVQVGTSRWDNHPGNPSVSWEDGDRPQGMVSKPSNQADLYYVICRTSKKSKNVEKGSVFKATYVRLPCLYPKNQSQKWFNAVHAYLLLRNCHHWILTLCPEPDPDSQDPQNLGLPDPVLDPLVRGVDPVSDPDPSFIS